MDDNQEVLVLNKASLGWWLWGVIFDWGMITLSFMAIAYANFNPFVIFIGMIVIGSRQHGLGLMAHEATHYNVCQNRLLNDWLSCLLTFWPLGYGLDAYREFHFAHHKNLGLVDDPEQIYKKSRRPFWDPPMTQQMMIKNYFKDLLGATTLELFHVIKTLKPVSLRDVLGPLLLWPLIIYVLYQTNLWWVGLIWFFCLGTSFWAVSRIRMWSEHIKTNNSHRFQANWWQRFILFPHNTWCHYEHHKWLNMPCHNLVKARKLDNEVPIVPSFGELLKLYQ